jgi:PAS domain S-box-containing protein
LILLPLSAIRYSLFAIRYFVVTQSNGSYDMPMTADDRINILIVDDLPEKILVLETVLADLGENVVTARSGSEALQHVLKHDFAVILLDVIMPDMDGYETAALIRQRKRSAHTPIIFITAFADEVHKAHGYSLGAVDYILSPVSPDILRTKVKVFVDLARMSDEIKRHARHADQRIELAKEQAAREAAERMADVLRASEERFRLASEAVNGFIYEVDVASGRMVVSPGLSDLLGFSPQEANNLAWWDERLHPDDQPHVQAARAEHMRERPKQYRSEYRVRHRDGRYLHVWDQGLVVCNAEGRAVRLVGNVVDITERKRAEEALAEANRRKDEFLAMLAHELRNPLAPIRNAVQILRIQGSTDPNLLWARDIIDRNVSQMVRLVDDLLDVSRITRGKIRLQMEPLDMAAVVEQAVEISRPLIDARRHRLSVSMPDEPIQVLGDGARLAQVAANLLNNAAKYTDEGGQIWLTLKSEGQQAVLRVRDTGVGLPQEMREEVFGLFTQVDRSSDRAQGGLGIGLTLVRRLVEMHGGRVEAFSEGPGRGSEFVVWLPILAELPKQPRDPAKSNSRPQSAGRTQRKILAVDDNIDAANTMAMLLRILGHDVRTAHDGASAIESAQVWRPDIVLLDIGLPGMDGYEVARRLRAIAELGGCVLVAVTGYGQEEDRRRSANAGFDHHLVKPVDPQALTGLLAECLPPTAAAVSGAGRR